MCALCHTFALILEYHYNCTVMHIYVQLYCTYFFLYLACRCVDGYCLLHWTAKLGSVSLTQVFIKRVACD